MRAAPTDLQLNSCGELQPLKNKSPAVRDFVTDEEREKERERSSERAREREEEKG